jgi:hypothetical protein
LGGALIVVGALAVYWAGDIPDRGLGANQDPGPRAFPIGLGVCLILGGLYELGRGLIEKRGTRGGLTERHGLTRGQACLLSPANRDLCLLLAGLAVYLLAIPWLGFSISTGLFATGMMSRLGVRWYWAMTVSIVLVVIIHLLFVNLFRVQLPPGRLGLL